MPYFDFYSYVGQDKLYFGKHKSKTLEEVWREDPDYCLNYLRYLRIPKYGWYINETYLNDIEYSEQYSRIKRTSVTSMIRYLDFYHLARIYNCFEGNHIFYKRHVHSSSSYPDSIIDNKLYSYNGVFYDLLIRKHIYNYLQNQNAVDFKTEAMLNSISKEDTFNSYKSDYEMFKDKNCPVMRILPGIFKLALLQKTVKQCTTFVNVNEKMTDVEHILEVLSYVDKIPNIERAILNPILNTAFFSADADLIIDDTIFDIKVSNKSELTVDDFLQLIFYAFAYYIREGIEIRKFVIYNPLLGLNHGLELKNLNFMKLLKFFEDVIKS